jgi:hypothetical protein
LKSPLAILVRSIRGLPAFVLRRRGAVIASGIVLAVLAIVETRALLRVGLGGVVAGVGRVEDVAATMAGGGAKGIDDHVVIVPPVLFRERGRYFAARCIHKQLREVHTLTVCRYFAWTGTTLPPEPVGNHNFF